MGKIVYNLFKCSIILCWVAILATEKPRVKRKYEQRKISKSASSENHPLYQHIPQGCYGQKQLRDILTAPHSEKGFKHKPKTPEWCSESEPLVPKRYKAHQHMTTAPPYVIHASRLDQSKDVYRVMLKSVHSNPIGEAIIAARPLNGHGISSSNIGTFIASPAVRLVCCSFTDKDVARFKSNDSTEEVITYWSPLEETTEDFEGRFIFLATVAKNSAEYWINVTSKPIDLISTAAKMFLMNNNTRNNNL